MSAEDHDGDSQMISSPSSTNSPTIPSPPDSQHRTTTAMPTSAIGANANGKRPINNISNGENEAEDAAAVAAGSSIKPRAEFPPKTHESSGYSWSREEDAPGYAWLNKKALDEFHRAADALAHQKEMVKGRYEDPFDMADRERAMINSLKEQ